MVLAFVVGTFGFNFQVTIALMAREVFDLGAAAFGLLSTRFAVGSLTGALLSTRRSAGRGSGSCVGAAVVFGAAQIAGRADAGVRAVRRAAGAHRAGRAELHVANNSFVQLGVDPQMRGRVMALYFMCFMGGTPLGCAADRLDLRARRRGWG